MILYITMETIHGKVNKQKSGVIEYDLSVRYPFACTCHSKTTYCRFSKE